MALPQDLLSRIINVKWVGGKMLLLEVGCIMYDFGTAPDPDFFINLSCPELGWSSSSLSGNLTAFTRADAAKVLFDRGNKRSEDYVYWTEAQSRTFTSTVNIPERIRFVSYNYVTNQLIVSGTGSGGILIPFTFDYTGDTSPDGPYPLFQSSAENENAIALAQANMLGYPGVSWIARQWEVVRTREETTTVTNKAKNSNRMIFINIDKIKADFPDLPKLEIQVTLGWQTSKPRMIYDFHASAALYNKTAQEREPDGGPAIPASNVWPRVTNAPSLVDPNINVSFPNGAPYFNPPNDESPFDRGPVLMEAYAGRRSIEGGDKPCRATLTLEFKPEGWEMDADLEFLN